MHSDPSHKRWPCRHAQMSRRTLLGSFATAALAVPLAPRAAPAPVAAVHVVGGAGGSTLCAALRRAADGDVVEIHADLDGETCVIERPGLTLRGAGRRRVLHAGGRSAEGKATIVVRAPGVVVEDIEFRGGRNASQNGAGIRFERGSLELRRCAFLDNEMGLLSAGGAAMTLGVFDCEFGAAPRHEGRLRHLLYVGAIGELTVSGCHFHSGFRGHLVKSRARVNTVIGNRLDDLPAGSAAYELEFPNGGRCVVAANVIAQSASSMNPALLSIGAEAGTGEDADAAELWLVHNTFVNAGDANGRFVHLWPDRLAGGVRVTASNNLLVGPGTIGFDAVPGADGNHRLDIDALRDPMHGDFRLREALQRDLAAAPLPTDGLPLREFVAPLGTRPWPAAGHLAPGAHPGAS
jgi:hypothetical protein